MGGPDRAGTAVDVPRGPLAFAPTIAGRAATDRCSLDADAPRTNALTIGA